MRLSARVVGSAALVLMAAAVARAAKPQSFSFSNQHDYTEGKFENTVVDSYGELTLGRSLSAVDLKGTGESVSAFAQTSDGAVYAAVSGVGGSAVIYRVDGEGKGTTAVYTAPKGFSQINALTADGAGNLLAGLSGEGARVVRVDPKGGGDAAGKTVFESKDVTYIWAIVEGGDGGIYVGTGPHGKVYRVTAGGESSVVLETKQKNVMSLALDGNGNLIAGTDANGLVIRCDGKGGKPFVLLDAGKVDVSGIVSDGAGNLYVATAKAEVSPDDMEDSGMGDEPETKSKPAGVEPEPVEPPDTDATQPTSQEGMLWEPRVRSRENVCAGTDYVSQLKAMMKAADSPKKKRKGSPTLPGRGVRGLRGLSSDSSETSEDASSLYRIGADGRVSTLVQAGGMNYALLYTKGGAGGEELLVGTGPEGKLYRYRPGDQSLALVARVRQQQISTLFADKSGAVFVGPGNMAKIYQLGAGLAKRGTFVSQALDASHTADWGHAWIDRAVPEGTSVKIATRSGNTQDVDATGNFWSEWTADSDAVTTKINSPGARYLQYRVTLTGDGASTPTVNQIRLGYKTENLPPRIKSVTVDASSAGDDSMDSDSGDATDEATPANILHITWDATDPNNDTLVYRVYYKHANNEKDPWTLVAKHVTDISYDWDTRAVPDGKYQVKVVASDAPDNAATEALERARASAPFTIDHTAPVMGELKGTVEGNRAKISGEAKDAMSPVVNVRYQIDGQGDWQPALAFDKIFDSPQEAFTIVTHPMSVGAHRVTVRSTDSAGNSSYKAVTVSVQP
ncbi:MAG: hypothetical protein ACTHN5_06025 [Phycisphaerae bacterium]